MSKKTKMSLAELAAMRGVSKPEQAGCTFDAELVPRDYEAEKAEAAKKAAEAEETANQARLAEKAAKKAAEAEEVRLELFNDADGWFIFACRQEVPFFFCPKTSEGDYLVPNLEGITFNAYRHADDFFLSEEVGTMPLDAAVELWRSTGHYTRHWVMNCYKEGRGRTVIQVLNGCYPSAEPASDWHWNDRDA